MDPCLVRSAAAFTAPASMAPRSVMVQRSAQPQMKGFFDILSNARDGGRGGLELLSGAARPDALSTLDKRFDPARWDTRAASKKVAPKSKSGKINPKDPKTW